MSAVERSAPDGRTTAPEVSDTIDLTGIVVHWHDERGIERLVSSWPADSRFELLVVDNGSDRPLDLDCARILRPGTNLGFAGAVNLALGVAQGQFVLLLNADVFVEDGALESLLEGFREYPQAAGLAPLLIDPEGHSQFRWQLRPLPSIRILMLQSLLLPAGKGPRTEPRPGYIVEQPAAAALAIRRPVLQQVRGLDELFYPAWFEDVDLAASLRESGHSVLYWPASRFRHRLGSTVTTLGFRRFLWIYYINLGRYLRKHHGTAWMTASRYLLASACLLRILLVPIRKPRRAASRGEAAGGLVTVMLGALSNWRFPRPFASLATPPDRPSETSS